MISIEVIDKIIASYSETGSVLETAKATGISTGMMTIREEKVYGHG
mgnify:CR=1 FL=1